MSISNTKECFTKFIGQRVVGCLFDALPVHRPNIASGTKTLVFEDGTGLTISGGSFWTENEGDIHLAVERQAAKLERTKKEIEGVLQVAGALERR